MNVNEIAEHFNKNGRVEQDLQNYGMRNVAICHENADPFEIHRENVIFEEIKTRLPENSVILDVGAGIGSLVIRLLKEGYIASGIDISESMVAAAKNNLKDENFDENKIFHGNFLELQYPQNSFNAILLNGVIWYYSDEIKKEILKKIYTLLAPNGYVVIVHRNDLFNMFALNQGTLDFFNQQLFSSLSNENKDSIQNKIQVEMNGLLTPVKNNATLPKPYDNPFTIENMYKAENLKLEEILYTYIHPAPPRFGLKFDTATYAAVQSKYLRDWQGMFLGSQFIVIAKK